MVRSVVSIMRRDFLFLWVNKQYTYKYKTLQKKTILYQMQRYKLRWAPESQANMCIHIRSTTAQSDSVFKELLQMKASESEWSNQRQEDSNSYKNFLPGIIIITCMEMIGVLTTMKCQLQSMSNTLLSTYACCKMLATVAINECQVSYLEMLGTYLTAGIHETVRYWNVIIHDM